PAGRHPGEDRHRFNGKLTRGPVAASGPSCPRVHRLPSLFAQVQSVSDKAHPQEGCGPARPAVNGLSTEAGVRAASGSLAAWAPEAALGGAPATPTVPQARTLQSTDRAGLH